jgi:hypothetical protein
MIIFGSISNSKIFSKLAPPIIDFGLYLNNGVRVNTVLYTISRIIKTRLRLGTSFIELKIIILFSTRSRANRSLVSLRLRTDRQCDVIVVFSFNSPVKKGENAL